MVGARFPIETAEDRKSSIFGCRFSDNVAAGLCEILRSSLN
jgi:hypothetical protein